ncbi:MAG: hypothetical protein ABI857_06730 [Acidobacteriota bacterium]
MRSTGTRIVSIAAIASYVIGTALFVGEGSVLGDERVLKRHRHRGEVKPALNLAAGQ